MRLLVTPESVRVEGPRGLAGLYRLDDPFKPHFHPLCTPDGHVLTARSPHDHLHHKGLMYALRTRDLNFWEEVETLPGERVGRQRSLGLSDVKTEGEEVGFTQAVQWEGLDGSTPAFRETRQIRCREVPEATGYQWTWKADLVALRPLELIQSQWSYTLPSGSRVNYHGLGMRFRRDFGGATRNNRLELDGEVYTDDFSHRMGVVSRRVAYIGSLDETRPVRQAGLAMEQEGSYGVHVQSLTFPFLTLGPTNLAPLSMEEGQTLSESFIVTVFDVPAEG